MQSALRLVLDIGKTTAKLSAWDDTGQCLGRFSHSNQVMSAQGYSALNVVGIEDWLVGAMQACAALGEVISIIPVGHGAAAAVLRGRALAFPVMDYEFPIPDESADRYDRLRDPIEVTGSPRMQWGLNLGCQLFHLMERFPELFDDQTQIVPWPQYWAWRLCGTAVSEVTSLGSHSDLWEPAKARPSPMARQLGLDAMLAPLKPAGEIIGTLSREWQDRTGLGNDVNIHVGLHDSNAALVAARGRSKFGSRDATMLSTGTWFVTMRSVAGPDQFDLAEFAQQPGCLINVDPARQPVPTALFMGGREFEELALTGYAKLDDPAIAAAAQDCIDNEIMALPCWAPGTGFYANRQASWLNKPENPAQKVAASLLYLALVSERALELVTAERLLVIDGPFANVDLFGSALARLRPDLEIVVANAENDVALGALRCIDPHYPIDQVLRPLLPLDADLTAYRQRWRCAIA
ncbi:MAG: FGGY-family carbohydrate kinase [Pseudomonadota bacterium]